MAHSRSQHPSARATLKAARLALIAFSLLLAAVAGCGGGSKPANEPATHAPAASDTAAAPAPGPDTSAIPVPAGTPGDPQAGAAAGLGAKVFATRCALCHGPDGHGDGVASKGLNPKPRNFHDTAYMSTRSDAQLLEVIHKGKGAMPKWEGQLSEAEIAAVLAHIRSLGK